MKKPLLSIGMIIKNEIRCLERCLRSLEPLRRAIPCQLVIADTGSTDGSRELAAQYADILFDFAWVNDFSAARNAVLERCIGEWHLFIDADEWLDNVQCLINFFTGPDSKKFNMGMVCIRNFLNIDRTRYADSHAGRIGKRTGSVLQFKGAVHETLGFSDGTENHTLLLQDVIFFHDGYIDHTADYLIAKKRRNMELLRETLENHPNDLRTLKECLDSSTSDKELRKYLQLSWSAANDPNNAGDTYRPGILKECLRICLVLKDYEEVILKLKKALEICPKSYLIRLDGEAYATMAAYSQQDWSAVIIHKDQWERALNDIQDGKDLLQSERLYVSYRTKEPIDQSLLRTLAASAHAQLGEHKAVAALLPRISVDLLEPANQVVLVNAVLAGAHTWPQGAAAWLEEFWQSRCRQAEEEQDPKKRQAARELREKVLPALRRTFPLGEEPGKAAPVLAAMGDGIPGQSARILLTQGPEELSCLLEQVTDWRHLFPEAYLHAMEWEAALPASFFRQTWEDLAALAARLARVGEVRMVRITARWLSRQPAPETPAQLTWQLDLITAAIQNHKDWEDVRLGQQLCNLYAGLAFTYLDNVYNPDLLNEEDLSILPGMHRFAWHYRRALSCLENGDELGYVRALRAGLDTAPAMKDMVDFLVDHIPKPQPAPSPELLALAEQVKAALAQYAPDDPAVLQLKATPVYQSVASLLEDGTSIPAKESPDPVLEDAIRALEKDCTFSTPTQAAIALQASYQGVHPDNQKSLADYWAKYPLWGETPDQVFAAAGKTFADHHDDLFWLFGRLADNQSRRVLLAVLSNWRFYDTWKLNAVKETKYDDYFDLDLLHCDDNEVVADLGAYIGDTFLSYVKNYGSLAYKRYYCYEITSDSFAQLAQVTKPYPRVILRRKGAGDGPGTMTLSTGSDASANTLTAADDAPQPETSEQETAEETVDIVALDDDITEPLTLIKMDIEGAEQSALRGCARHIREDRPKLALSVYHNFEDIWKLPRMIEALVPGYRFYLRYHGGDLWASEISLLALPPEGK